MIILIFNWSIQNKNRDP